MNQTVQEAKGEVVEKSAMAAKREEAARRRGALFGKSDARKEQGEKWLREEVARKRSVSKFIEVY